MKPKPRPRPVASPPRRPGNEPEAAHVLPCPANRYWVEHAERLRRTFHALTGRDLLDPTLSPEAAAEALFHAPFVVLSHDAAPDPLLTYGNQAALELFELAWAELIRDALAPDGGSARPG